MDAEWWSSLDDAWKTVFRKALEFKGEPTPAILEKIAAMTHVYAAKSEITSLAPLAALPAVTHIDFSGCKNLQNLDGIPRTVRILVLHWTTMDDLTWVDALPGLEKVYGDKELQTRINRRIGANKRKRGR